MKFAYRQLDHKSINQWNAGLKELEERFVYPLGEDSFTISHGENYMAFFKRIGRDCVCIVNDKERIAAVGAGVISHRHRAWYLCDMKVHPEYRGNKIPRKLFTRYFFFNYLKCQKGYALTMDDSSGRVNPILKIMQNLPWTPLKFGARIVFFYEDTALTQQALNILSSKRRNIHFSSLRGIKDLILKSTQQPLPLLHMEWGPPTSGGINFPTPQPGQLHMWSLSESDPLVNELKNIGIVPKASGSIFHHRMQSCDWSELRTSEL